MEKTQIEFNDFKIYAPDSINCITKSIYQLLNRKLSEYKKLFNIDNYRQVQVNLFDNINDFERFIKENFNDTISNTAGTYHGGMINCYVEKDIEIGSDRYYSNLHLPCHELFHLMYNEIVLKNASDKRIVWYDEGMAQFMSSELDFLDEERFKTFYLNVKKNTKEIVNFNNINHNDNNFVNDKYNGYDISYLCIKYLSEILSIEEFINLMSDFDKIKYYGDTIIINMFDYYDKKLLSKQR